MLTLSLNKILGYRFIHQKVLYWEPINKHNNKNVITTHKTKKWYYIYTDIGNIVLNKLQTFSTVFFLGIYAHWHACSLGGILP